MNPDTERMLRDLAESLGTTVEKLWAVMVQGQIMMGYRALIMMTAGLVILVIGNHYYRKCWRLSNELSAKEQDPWPDRLIGLMVFSVICMVVGFGYSAVQLHEALTRLLSPEYSALAKIVEWTLYVRR